MGQKGALTGQGWHLWGRRYTYGAGGALMGQKGALMGLGWHLWGRRGHLWGRVGTYGAEVATYGAVTHIYFLPPPPIFRSQRRCGAAGGAVPRQPHLWRWVTSDL